MGCPHVHADFVRQFQPENLHRFVQFETAATGKGKLGAAHFNFSVRLDRRAGFILLLVVDIDNAFHNHGFGFFVALRKSRLKYSRVQSDFVAQ